MDILDLKKQIKSNSLNHFYVFICNDYGIMRVYLEQIQKHTNLPLCYMDSVSDIIQELKKPSLFAEDKCWVVRDADYPKNEKAQDYIDANIGKNILILIADSVDKRNKFYNRYKDVIIEFNHIGTDILVKYMQKEYPLDEYSCRELAEICENDYSRILLEIDKIKTYAQADPTVNPYKQLMSDGTIYIPPRDAVFMLVDAVSSGHITDSFELLRECYEVGESPLVIINVLYNRIKQILQVKSCRIENISQSTGLSEWQIKCVKPYIATFSISELVNAIRLIRRVEKGIKIGEIDSEIAVDYILVNILR